MSNCIENLQLNFQNHHQPVSVEKLIGKCGYKFRMRKSRVLFASTKLDTKLDDQLHCPPVRVSSVAACRGHVSWMFRLRTPNFFSAMPNIPNVRGAARLPRPRLVLVGAVIGMPHVDPSCLWSFPSSTTVVLPSHAGETSLLDTGMALNWAQLLVHDGEALAQFRTEHRIPNDVVIEWPGPNDDADWVEGEGNRIPIRTWFIYQAGLRFPLSKLLRTVLSLCGLTFMQILVNFVQTVLAVEALMQREGLEFTTDDLLHVYCVVKPRKNPETQMLEGNHYLCLRKPIQPQTRSSSLASPILSLFLDIGWHSRKVSDLLGYVPLYRYTIPLRATHQGRPRLLEEAEGESSDSSESSSFSWDVDLGDEDLDEEAEVEDSEEVDQVPAAAPLVLIPLVQFPDPIILLSSDSDIAVVEPREVVEHSYSCSGSSFSGSRGNEETMAPKVKILRKGQALRTEPARLPEDHETCIALGNAIMLPQDIADHAAETTAEFGGKLVMLGAQTKSELADARSTTEIATLQRNQAQQETSELKVFACGEVYKKLFDCAFERAGDVYERQLAELCPGIFQEGWLAYFNEEEYATLPADEVNVNAAVAEARAGIEGTVDGDRAGETEGDQAGEAEGAVICSRQMSLSSSLLRLQFLEDLYKFWGIKMLVVHKIRILDLGGIERCFRAVPICSQKLSFAEYRSLVGTLPYLEATIHKAAPLLAVLDDRSVVPLSFRMEGCFGYWCCCEDEADMNLPQTSF
ncbi:hypothetical protein Acr_12g0003140 [Actinidia rufa]|uniref:Uncharacterized protein n=1 Tax=Actinidia rufa TaxID=165716 RepID=A0A7J0FGQ6_9ERIC|nr:hypothetical protein Acr_12g0003140 [Actinidia rufa]